MGLFSSDPLSKWEKLLVGVSGLGGCIEVVEMGPYGEEKSVARTTF